MIRYVSVVSCLEIWDVRILHVHSRVKWSPLWFSTSIQICQILSPFPIDPLCLTTIPRINSFLIRRQIVRGAFTPQGRRARSLMIQSHYFRFESLYLHIVCTRDIATWLILRDWAMTMLWENEANWYNKSDSVLGKILLTYRVMKRNYISSNEHLNMV